MNTKSSSRSFPKGLDMTGKDERIGKKELEVNNHVKYSAFAIVLANALYLVLPAHEYLGLTSAKRHGIKRSSQIKIYLHKHDGRALFLIEISRLELLVF